MRTWRRLSRARTRPLSTLGQDPLQELAARVRELQGGNAELPVVISADRNVKYEAVLSVMDDLQKAQVKRVGLLVQTTGK